VFCIEDVSTNRLAQFYFEYGAASAVFGFWAFGSPKTTGWYKLGGTKCYSLMFDGTAADVEMGEEKVH
jgi:hypothetical protein